MIYRNLYFQIIVRILLIVFNVLVLFFSYFRYSDWLIELNLLAILIIQTVLLIRYLNKSNMLLEQFLSAAENHESQTTISNKKMSGSFTILGERLQKINSNFNTLRLKSEAQNHFFKAILESIDIAVVVADASGDIEIMNNATRRLLHNQNAVNISQFDIVSADLPPLIKAMKHAQQNILKVYKNGEMIPLLIRVAEMRLSDKFLKIITLQNIKNELEVQEIDSWQRLIRVLTHEIMNSVSPITSTLDTIAEFIQDENNPNSAKQIAELNQELLNDTLKGIQIIKDRSIGLQAFVQNFRSLTMLPKLQPEKFEIGILFQNVCFLMSKQIQSTNIQFVTNIYPPHLQLFADRKLIEQTLLNLMKNAIEAIETTAQPEIELKAFATVSNSVVIQVIDNGIGISTENIDNIFIPFFTTKPDGSGIGLSLSRQIMRLHSGNISVQSTPQNKTIFALEF